MVKRIRIILHWIFCFLIEYYTYYIQNIYINMAKNIIFEGKIERNLSISCVQYTYKYNKDKFIKKKLYTWKFLFVCVCVFALKNWHKQNIHMDDSLVECMREKEKKTSFKATKLKPAVACLSLLNLV